MEAEYFFLEIGLNRWQNDPNAQKKVCSYHRIYYEQINGLHHCINICEDGTKWYSKVAPFNIPKDAKRISEFEYREAEYELFGNVDPYRHSERKKPGTGTGA